MTQAQVAPSWLARIFRRAPLERRQTAPIPFHSEVRHFGLGPTNQPGADDLLRESLGWSAIATKAIADRIASLELVAFRTATDGDEEQVERAHPLAKILRSGSSLHGPIQTQRLVAQYLVTIGEAYLLKVRGNEITVPVALWVMNGARVQPIPTGGVIRSYRVTRGDGGQVEIPAEDVVRIWWPDPENIYGAEGLLGPQGTIVDTTKFADQTMRAHFEQNAMPRAVIEASDGATPSLDPAEIAAMNELWQQRFNRRGGSQRGLPAWLPSGFHLQELQALGGVTEYVSILQHYRDQVLMGFGVPRSILGDVVDANRATAETNQYVFDTHTIKPIADVISEALTLQLAVPEFGDEYRVGFAEFAPADKDFELRRVETELRMKLRSVNEVRVGNGEDEVAWGDLPVGTIGEAPYTGEEDMQDLQPDDPNALDATQAGDTADDDEPRSRSAGRARITPAAEWQRVLARERRWQPVFARAYREVLAVQERTVKAELAKLFAARALERVDVHDVVVMVRTVLAAERWSKLFERKTARVRTASYVAAGQEAFKLVGVTAAFELSPETAKRLRASEAEFRTLVSNTSVKRVSHAVIEELAKGVEAGEALSARAARVEAAVGRGFLTRRHEARTIARTETLKTTQAAQLDGYETSGVVEGKQWNTSQDDAVRDSHVATDGQVVDLGEDFTLGSGARGDAPGASSLPAEDVINCLLPGTVVSGAFIAGVRALYAGQAREIYTRNGRCLRVTPGHPVATERGFVPAYKLAEGDYVIGCAVDVDCQSVPAAIAAEQVEHAPTTIEQVFDALALRWPTEARQVRADHFHGDGVAVQGEVDVVRADGTLLANANSARAKHLSEFVLVDAAPGEPRLRGLGSRDLDGSGIDLPATRTPSGTELTLNVHRLGPLQALRFGSAAAMHVALAEPAGQSDTADAAFLRELFQRHAADIALDQIVEIRDIEFDGHVYDLQSDTGWMVAQGFVVSNCRCFVTPVLEA
jgi:phage portal protein BeeE